MPVFLLVREAEPWTFLGIVAFLALLVLAGMLIRRLIARL